MSAEYKPGDVVAVRGTLERNDGTLWVVNVYELRGTPFASFVVANSNLAPWHTAAEWEAVRAVVKAVREAKVQRDPRHRVSMLVNDWNDICAAVNALGEPRV